MNVMEGEVRFRDVGKNATVPDNDIARLMYYLHSVTKGCGVNVLQNDLVDYRNFSTLSKERADFVLIAAFQYSPDEMIDKVIFLDEEGKLCGTKPNAFINIEREISAFSAQSSVIIAGKQTEIQKIMVFKNRWLETYYINPLKRNQDRLVQAIARLSSNDSEHSAGRPGKSVSTSSPRKPDSRYSPSRPQSEVFKEILEDLDETVGESQQNKHNTDGTDHLTQPNSDTDQLGASPNTSESSKKHVQKKRSITFYDEMSTKEMKDFLEENGVSFRGIFEAQDLRRLVWECYINSIRNSDLAETLTELGIDQINGLSDSEKREMAKRAFKNTTQPQPDSTSNQRKHKFKKGDAVILQGLKAAHMNGMYATVSDGSVIEGTEDRIDVTLDISGKTIRVKTVNLELVSEIID